MIRKDRKKRPPRFVKFETPFFGKATEMFSQQSLNIYACMWIEWTISIRWVGLLICARVGLFWVGNINGTKFPDTARLQPIPPPMISTEKRRKKFQTRLRNGCMTAGRLVGWLGGGRCSLHKNASFGQNNFVHTALLKKQQILKGWNSKLRWLVWEHRFFDVF